MKKRILLLGCTGEVGSRLSLKLVKSGFEVFGVRLSRKCNIDHPLHTCFQRDLLNTDLDAEIQYLRPQILVHTSWYTTPNIFWDSDKNRLWVEASKRIVNSFEKSGGGYLAVTGSCAEYSWKYQEPLSEISCEKPESIYGKSRMDLLNWLKGKELPFLWSRTFFQFGLNEPKGRLIPTLIDNLNKGEISTIRSGSDIRDFVFVEDVVSVLHKLIIAKNVGIFNVGSGVGIEVAKIASQLAHLMGREELLNFVDNSTRSVVVSNSLKLEAAIGNYRWQSLDHSLLKSIQARKTME
jgi:nucleoside-diphosphate-sugar epimerase